MSLSFEIHAQAQMFLEIVLNNLRKYNLDLSFPDHLCFRVETSEQYQEYKNKFSEIGTLLIESEIGGRNIATYKLANPIIFEDYQIDVIELPAPKAGKSYLLGFEHIEFVVKESFEQLMKDNRDCEWDTKGTNKGHNPELRIKLPDNLSAKFHHQSLEKVIEIEKNSL